MGLFSPFETIHHMSNCRGRGKHHMASKLDLSKAYDRVEWHFLEEVMRAMGFSECWISRVMTCVHTINYTISVNGNHSERIYPTRGIRQGDPLSLYLFLLCMEGFTCLLKKAEIDGEIEGDSVARHAPKISHLFFADDSLLFCRATVTDCRAIINTLKMFELASGQQINIEKSSILFSSNILAELKAEIMSFMGVHRIMARDKYLGLPIMIGKSKKRELQYIKDRLITRVRSWKGKFLSIAGKSVLIQSIAQSIPQYLMSVFKFPQTFLHELNMIVAHYYWSNGSDRKRIHWRRWDSLCISKLDGGLGFRDLEAFNLALLAKQFWRLIHNEDSLCYKVLKAKYSCNSSFLHTRLGRNPSFLWRSLMAGRRVILEGSRWRIGSGIMVDVWSDHWINSPSNIPHPLPGITQQSMKVAELIDHSDMRWDSTKITSLLQQQNVNQILSQPLPLVPQLDKLIWNDFLIGVFTVKSGYFTAQKVLGREEHDPHQRSPQWRLLWQSNVLPKIKFFNWRLFHNILPSKGNLRQKGLDIDDFCNVCAGNEDSLHHIFFSCLLLAV